MIEKVDDVFFAYKLTLSTTLTFLTNYEIKHQMVRMNDKVKALLHPNLSNDNLPKEIFMIEKPI
jgi:hypothetical protein